MDTAAIVLAAGKSTRMKSELPKVLHEICGRPMLSYVTTACRLAGVDRLIVVVGHGKELVRQEFSEVEGLAWVEQREQKGTGHAVQCCRGALSGFTGSIMVIAGDMPLIRRETLAGLLEAREQSGDGLTMATTVLDDPTGYGRIVRDAHGDLEAIVEDRDCSDEQRAIHEVNPSYYCFDSAALWTALDQVKPNPVKGEYYITDTVSILRRMGRVVSAIHCLPAEDAAGINSRLDLAMVGRLMQDRIQLSLMNEGVTIVDPDNTWIDSDATIGRDTIVYPFSFIGAGARIGEGCKIGPFARISGDEALSDGTCVAPTSCNGAVTI